MLPFAEKHLERVIYSHSTSTFLSFLKLIPVTLFTEFTVVKITNDLHVSKSRGQFLALILLDPLSSLDIANHFLEYFFLSWFHKYKHSLRFPYIPELFFLSLLCWLFLSLWCLNLEDLWFFLGYSYFPYLYSLIFLVISFIILTLKFITFSMNLESSIQLSPWNLFLNCLITTLFSLYPKLTFLSSPPKRLQMQSSLSQLMATSNF